MAYLFKYKTSPYFYIGWYNTEAKKNGRPVSTKTKSEREAKLQLKLFEERLKVQGNDSAKPRNASMKLSEAYKLYVTDRANTGRAYSQLTLDSYKDALNKFYAACGDVALYKYTRDSYNDFADSMQQLSQNSRSIYSKRIHALFCWLVKEKYLKENPMRRIAEEPRELIIKTDSEINEVLRYAVSTKYLNLLRFSLISAFRISESLKLKYSDVRSTHIRITGKGGKNASIPILSEMTELLRDIITSEKKKSDELVFPFSYDTAQRFAVRVRKNIGIKFNWHDTRKYCLSKMANAGVPINFVKGYARHDSINTTLKYYIRVDEGKMKSEIESKVKNLIPKKCENGR